MLKLPNSHRQTPITTNIDTRESMKEAKYSRRSPHREEIQPIYKQAGPRLWLAEEDDADGIFHREPKEEQETPTTNAEGGADTAAAAGEAQEKIKPS
jgi:hypothetical protein